MTERGHRVFVLTADEAVPKTDVFIALHQDGSTNSRARGASVGYQTDRSEAYAQTWKNRYADAGWPGGFRADNYTAALRNYYGFRRASSPVEVLMEHGFATNRLDEDWMWDHIDRIARVHADTLDLHTGTTPPPSGGLELSDEALQQIEAMYNRIVIGAPQYGVDSMWEQQTEALRQLTGQASGNNLRRFIQDQDRRTRELTQEGLDDLWAKIQTLANEGGDGGPINVSDADATKIARAVLVMLDDHPLAPTPPI
jgi:hypothetical protein